MMIIIIIMFEQGDLLSLVFKRRKTIIFFNSVKWMIVNVTKWAPENTLVLDQLSEEGFDL